RAAHVVAVAGGAVGDDAPAVVLLDLARLERLDHALARGHAADPHVGFDAHALSGRWRCARQVGCKTTKIHGRDTAAPAGRTTATRRSPLAGDALPEFRQEHRPPAGSYRWGGRSASISSAVRSAAQHSALASTCAAMQPAP